MRSLIENNKILWGGLY